MKRSLLGVALVLTVLLSLSGGAARPAEASEWFIGGSFNVGGAHFSLTFDRYHRHHHPYYYRTEHRLRYDGYGCGSYCFKRSRYTYHHPSCALVGHHFRRYGHHPSREWGSYRGRGHAYGHDKHKYYDRGHRDYGYRYDRRRDYGHRDYGYDRYRDYGHRDYRHRYDHRHHDPRYCPYR